MNAEPERTDAGPERRAASERSPDLLAGSEAEQRADVEEDRRRQRDLDDAELGGEA